ncbi:NUDIX hydrolase [Singulisphaera sp. PoT]|uniref:NUDIX hydrolase n=1 Tax=Singulisphaera sp. PoT TaxID=3411797 RepID=UPI003BF5498B
MADRVLAGIVLISGDKVLLVLSRKDARAGRWRWSIPKGRYKSGSDVGLFDAAARELKEEAGIDLAGVGVGMSDCVGRGVLTYSRKGRSVELHHFVLASPLIVLDSRVTAGEAMAGVGLFDHGLARTMIAEEQHVLIDMYLPGSFF